ncbi:hypothetical protein JL193_01320 [Polaribacter batillariae]|uniref:Uncharacterized protein n=1 Tax=Polaribacter batillariae TaxID=2808900 RepID=A0ABX7SUP9_9FLAO|nr:hypothetical protein [Polaribacter batillariae]QTD37974.1 hypothetical protein JL193_01320 [Polaribacter batillariae]
MSNKERASAENVTKGNSGDVHEQGLHPLKGTVKKGYKDTDSNKDRLKGEDKDKLKDQVHSATDESNDRVADKIQNSDNKKSDTK